MKSPFSLVLAFFAFAPFAAAQQSASAEAGGPSGKPALAALEFSKPKAVEGLGPGSMIAGRFDCGEDGSIYTLVAGDAPEGDPESHVSLLGIHSDGTATSFPWWSVPGFTKVTGPGAIFTGNKHVYVLVRAESGSEQNERSSTYPAILVFNLSGALEGTVRLESGSDPVAFGVFPSGNILLVSGDRLNHRMSLSLVRDDGSPLRELTLGREDFVTRSAEMPVKPRGTATYSPLLLIAMTKVLPLDGHLLLVPMEAGDLPMVEVGEHGVLGSTTPHLPADLVLEGLVSSSASSYTLHLAKHIDSFQEGSRDAQGKVLAIAIEPYQRLTEISRADGSVLGEIGLGSGGIKPACEANGVYRLLTSGSEKKLQVVTARLR
jgi:hypothetical protein